MMISVAAVAIRSGSNNNNSIQKLRKTLIFTRAKACVFVCRDPEVDVGGECGNARQDKASRSISFYSLSEQTACCCRIPPHRNTHHPLNTQCGAAPSVLVQTPSAADRGRTHRQELLISETPPPRKCFYADFRQENAA